MFNLCTSLQLILFYDCTQRNPLDPTEHPNRHLHPAQSPFQSSRISRTCPEGSFSMHKSFPLLGLGSVQSKPILSDIDIRISIPGINLRNIVQQCVTPVLDNNIDNVEFRGKVVWWGCLLDRSFCTEVTIRVRPFFSGIMFH